jgi:hypothetical protein
MGVPTNPCLRYSPTASVTTTIPSQVKKSVEAPIKDKLVKHEPSPRYTTDYMVTMNHNGKIVVKYVGPYTKKTILRSMWIPKSVSI